MTPQQQVARQLLPYILKCQDHLNSLGAPQASTLAARVGTVLADLIDVSEDISAYYRKWAGSPEAAHALQILVDAYNAEYAA